MRRRRQHRKFQELEKVRQKRIERETREEFERRIEYTVGFGGPTLAELETDHEIYQVVIIEGAHWANRALKIEGTLTPAGIELKQKLRREAGL